MEKTTQNKTDIIFFIFFGFLGYLIRHTTNFQRDQTPDTSKEPVRVSINDVCVFNTSFTYYPLLFFNAFLKKA